MDALLVNQTDVEGGKVQDEAPIQLEEGERDKKCSDKRTNKQNGCRNIHKHSKQKNKEGEAEW